MESRFLNLDSRRFGVKNREIVLSTSNANKSMNAVSPGTLYVVATPIGHRDDITVRALEILARIDLIAAEDTRKTSRFLERHGIKGSCLSYHEHNEKKRTPQLLAKLQSGTSIALVSNAGTPTVSDPGYRLITAAVANDVRIVPVPGASAVAAALSVAGLPTDTFTFIGFLPKKKAKRLKQLENLAIEPRTLIFYESPHRLLNLIDEIIDTIGDRQGVLAREMTKLHEEFIRGCLSEILENLGARAAIKGECTLLVAGHDSSAYPSWLNVRQQIETAVAAGHKPIPEIAREIASASGIAKNRIYAEALKISKQLGSG